MKARSMHKNLAVSGARSLMGVMAVLAVLESCKRVPLTPPNGWNPQFAFEGVFNGSAMEANESTGHWVHATDTLQGMVNHALQYAHEATGEVWELVYHVPVGDSTSVWAPGEIAHRPTFPEDMMGTATIPELWLAYGYWSVNGESAGSASVNWEANDDDALEIEIDVHWMDDEDDEFEQEVMVELEGLSGCSSLVLPNIPLVFIEGNTATIFPPVEDEGVAWAWEIENIDYQTVGNEPIVISIDENDEEVSLDIKLEPGGQNHPYGEFFVSRRFEWYADSAEDLPSELWGNLMVMPGLTDATAWMELRYRDADGIWFSSSLMCEEADQEQWRFEVQSIQGVEGGSTFAGFEAMTFSCSLPLREEGVYSTDFVTASLAGTWPIQPL